LKAKEDASAIATELSKTVKGLEAKLDAMATAQAKELAEASFNTRMSLVDSEFDLSDEDRKAIASDITSLSDDASFEAWYGKFSVYAAAKKKKVAPVKKDDDGDKADDDKKDKQAKADDSEEATASEEEKKQKLAAAAVEASLKNAKENGSVIKTGVDTSESLVEKYKSAFGKDGIVLKK